MSVTLNHYVGTYPLLGKKSCMAVNMEIAAHVFNAKNSADPVLIQCVEENIDTEMPVPMVHFETRIEPNAAKLSGCIAAPKRFTVPEGSRPIFSAIPALGWDFDHWEVDGAQTEIEPTTQLEMTSPTSGGALNITAVFVAQPIVP